MQYYSRNLVTSRIEVEEEVPEELVNGDGGPEEVHRMTTRRMSERIPEMEELELEQMPAPPSPSKGTRKAATKPRKDAAELKSPAKKRRKHDKENREGSQTPRPKTPRATDSERFSNHLAENDFEHSIDRNSEVGRDGTLHSMDPARPSGRDFTFQPEEDDYGNDDFAQPMSVGPVSQRMLFLVK